MTIAGAIAVTAAILTLAALICALIADESRDRVPAIAAWALFVVATILGVAAAWVEVLA